MNSVFSMPPMRGIPINNGFSGVFEAWYIGNALQVIRTYLSRAETGTYELDE